uniref:Plastid light harvesting protein n=1 Tax=Grammatophora oceanica TaxID=210454 RepID=A0A6U5N243_9STRA|mmetsp:Transcript_4185/g.5754  ORF Transcript_4185/g.5754 Transcript_4185/m.5754 type:complete len:240 (+) Transcript_4185:209-928(+)
MKIAAAFSLFMASASAFGPFNTGKSAPTELKVASMNGWAPNDAEFAYGLPGSIDPIADFDPLGLAEKADFGTMMKYREAELQHGRVAMLAAIGMLVTEEPVEFHPLFESYNKDIGPAIRHLDEVRAVSPFFFEILAVIIGALEFNRALTGWLPPDEAEGNNLLKDGYFPGDVGFDPLGLKPEDPEEFLELHTKELQNGRVAMLGAAGMIAQELVNGKEIFVNLGVAQDRFDPSLLPVQF